MPPARVLVSCIPLALLLVAGASSARERPPHVPTEEELRQRLGGPRPPDIREYQRESVHGFGQQARNAAAWVKERLAGLHVTPARLFLGLGVLGIIVCWNKNKKLVRWAVLTVFTVLFLIVGVFAMVFDWPYMN